MHILHQLIFRMAEGVYSEEFSKSIEVCLQIQSEIASAEQQKKSIETELTEKESVLKSALKKGGLNGVEIVKYRKEVEKLRTQMQNCETQLGNIPFRTSLTRLVQIDIFKKRKISFYNDLSEKQQFERRKQQQNYEVEVQIGKVRISTYYQWLNYLLATSGAPRPQTSI